MKKSIILAILIAFITLQPSFAGENSDNVSYGKVTAKTVVAGAVSLLVWPGIGQAINDQPKDKIVTHALFGLIPPVGQIWSCYDAVRDRKGGYWEGKI